MLHNIIRFYTEAQKGHEGLFLLFHGHKVTTIPTKRKVHVTHRHEIIE